MSNSTELPDRGYIVSLCVLNALFASTAVVLNSVTIHAIRKTSSASLSKNLRVLLLNLAFSDLSVGLVVQPFYVIQLTFSFESQEGDSLQKMRDTLSLATEILFLCASILGVLVLSVDRFLAVFLHLRYQEIVTPKRVVSILILSWVISTIIVSLPWITHEYHDFLSIFLNFFLITCLITIAFLQCKIYSIVRRRRFQIHSQQVQGSGQTQDEMRTTFERRKPSARGAFHIYLILLICYLPKIFTEFAMTGMKSEEIFLIILQESTTTLVFVNSCLNPLIYCWKLRHIRRTIRMTLRNVFFFQGHSGARCCGN
ncbi:histamine H2 receptor-like [Acropora muricata]|uniref:histamine H2 receptor-like n=1 Tax=Acropora muricata TaxID=159855 RepID=UPI0034E5BD77